ncbi:MAG: glycosyltransferase family 2 protein [Thaumarchaeota archaeon]|nr:glycosyltransferase family 2 protein [Nitrososphaerota archaeon]
MDYALLLLEVLGWAAGTLLFALAAYSAALLALGGGPPVADAVPRALSPKVTVLISALRPSPGLDDTLRRAAAVDYAEAELILALGSGDGEGPTYGAGLARPPRVFVSDEPRGKAHMMNMAVREAKGELVLMLDEDSLVDPGCVRETLPLVQGEHVWAVVGVPYPSNADAGVIQRTLGLEAAAWTRTARAKDRLGLFLPATGFFALIDKGSLPEGEAWDEGALAEDADLSLRQEARGLRTRLSGAKVGIEAPVSLGALARQRLRWYKGMFDALWKNRGVVVRLPFRKALDAVMSLLAPLSPAGFVILLLLAPVWPLLLGPVLLGVLAVYLVSAWVSASKLTKGRLGVVLFSVPYAVLQGVVALGALSAFLLHVRVRWQRTPKSGDTAKPQLRNAFT